MGDSRSVQDNWTASRDTVSKLAINGPRFNVGRETLPVVVEGVETEAILLHSIRTDWVGWVPKDEVVIGP